MQYWTSFCLGNSSVSKCLVCNFCSSDRGFASDFLQTPPHDGRPCLWITVPTAKPVADFHRQVITRAERTNKNRPLLRRIIPLLNGLFLINVYGNQVRLRDIFLLQVYQALLRLLLLYL